VREAARPAVAAAGGGGPELIEVGRRGHLRVLRDYSPE